MAFRLTSRRSRTLVCFIAVVFCARSAESQSGASAQADSPKAVRTIVTKLQAAVRNNEWRVVATLIVFPLEIKKPPLGVTSVPSVAVFMKVYPSVFTAKLREALMKQNPDSIVVRNGTATIAEGRIVIGFRCMSADSSSCSTGVLEVTPYSVAAPPQE